MGLQISAGRPASAAGWQPPQRTCDAAGSFAQSMQDAMDGADGVRFSRHAAQRLASRNLSLAGETMQKLREAVDKAAGSGQRDSLVLLGQLALIVDVPGRTVVTAVSVDSMQSSVFTHIDGAVIA